MSRRTSTTRDYKSRRASRAAGGELARARRGPADGDAATLEEHRTEDGPPETPRLFLGLLRHSPKKGPSARRSLPAPPLSAVLIQRRLRHRDVASLVPRGCGGAAGPQARRTAGEQSGTGSPLCAPPPTPHSSGPDVSLTGAAAVPSAARAPPPRLQGNRGFRLLLWEPKVTVYSHGRPAARPRAAPRTASPG
ncbi:hypothetical protein mRhiFer1_008923 [Rhinolophus ferrumequinum]|uniref:Uncharacterized protein n=1 Tax=Rhinolophus ferrumequinum TaxID=59479 RepID=A0A7J7TET0_RHIFE|nr:hypothetical protein mRhiFer1_008923 [Rhinolophus ferrumequinum]